MAEDDGWGFPPVPIGNVAPAVTARVENALGMIQDPGNYTILGRLQEISLCLSNISLELDTIASQVIGSTPRRKHHPTLLHRGIHKWHSKPS